MTLNVSYVTVVRCGLEISRLCGVSKVVGKYIWFDQDLTILYSIILMLCMLITKCPLQNGCTLNSTVTLVSFSVNRDVIHLIRIYFCSHLFV